MRQSAEEQLASALEAARLDVKLLQRSQAYLSDRLAQLASQLDADKNSWTAQLQALTVCITESMEREAGHLAAPGEAETQIAALAAQNAAVKAERDLLGVQLLQSERDRARLSEMEAERSALAAELAAACSECAALRDRIAANEEALRSKEAAFEQQAKERQVADAAREAAFAEELQTVLANSRTDLVTIEAERDQLAGRLSQAERNAIASAELEICHRLEHKAIFIMGFARSSTTITLQILNAARNAQLLGEANFFIPNSAPRFRDWYNDQHKCFDNQVTKSSFAADFVPEGPHRWYEWLNAAASYYDAVGEKIAFSANHFSLVQPSDIQAFYERRFFNARYIFLIRNPMDTLFSTARLFEIRDEAELQRHCSAWLTYLQLWADWIRVFPRSMTIIAEELNESTVDRLATFTGLGLERAKILIRPEKICQYDPVGRLPWLKEVKTELMAIYDDAVEAAHSDPVIWQAEQKREIIASDSTQKSDVIRANVPLPLGKAWARADALRRRLPPEAAK